MCNILHIASICCAHAQHIQNIEDIEASNNISFKDSMCICCTYAVYVKTIIISKNYMISLSNSAYAWHMPFVACDRLSHVKKLSMVRKLCQVCDFDGVEVKIFLTMINFLTTRNFFLTTPSWDSAEEFEIFLLTRWLSCLCLVRDNPIWIIESYLSLYFCLCQARSMTGTRTV